jgi:hypothetical protein
VVGTDGFEPPTSCSQSRRATGLRYAPTITSLIKYTIGIGRASDFIELFSWKEHRFFAIGLDDLLSEDR